ncbi:murein biosynthesis integral membrane protein MurJ [Saccharospirillum sp. MSK14-1]|uniref:murein biosynthesis integral membrane protein MurJ n=1 Tax=Saccharospirillum sp. MSK14-1 TaxID=1897632 RepID=UPI000D393127|nr:murein biosynthesis integral membrane protein MurJ [Saccharospirillum sp. MSK14-1]PTY38115.1 murein biosynthesis integral membrane protein MurJ [Saccharospirillum sp. MSK14-1]
MAAADSKPVKSRSGLLSHSMVVAAATMVSRVLGMTRDVVFAVLFGAGGAMDAFFVAFKVPNFLRRLFAEGAFNQAFIPVLSQIRQEEGDAGVRRLVAATQVALGSVVGLITLIAMVAAPAVAWLFAPGFHDDGVKLAQTADFLRLTFPYLWFISLTALGQSVLNTYNRFAAPAITPVILNLCLIGAAFWLTPQFDVPMTGLAIGVLIAGLLQWLWLWPSLIRLGVWQPLDWRARHAGVKRIAVLMVPALFGVSVSQINLLLDTVLASLLVDGSVGWLYYSDRLSELPLGVIGIAIGTVLLPRLSSQSSAEDPDAFKRTLGWALSLVLTVGLPAMAALVVLAEPLLTALFQYQAFTPYDVSRSAASLMAYAVGLPAFMLIKILAPAFFARQDTRTPVRIAIWAMSLNMVFNLLLIIPLAHVGLALATALSSWVNAGMLAWTLSRERRLPALALWWPAAVRALFASAVMALALLGLMQLEWMALPADIPGRIWRVGLLVAQGLSVFAVVWVLAGGRPRHLTGH